MFETILTNYLITCENLTQYLTLYNDGAAIFNKKAPDDNNAFWNDKNHYGRVVCYVNMQADTEHKISGTLEMDAYTQDEAEVPKIIDALTECVDGYFFTGETETILVKWNTTRYFSAPDKRISGAAVICTLIAFPSQLTREPDPIRVINDWTRSLLPDVKLIGYDTDLETVWKPTEDIPAVYWRSAKTYPCERVPSVYAGNWYTVQMYAHIFTVDTDVSNALAALMCRKLDAAKVLKFSDGTCMRIDNNNQVQPGADVLRVGQLSAEGDYCVLREKTDAELLENIIIND